MIVKYMYCCPKGSLSNPTEAPLDPPLLVNTGGNTALECSTKVFAYDKHKAINVCNRLVNILLFADQKSTK